jgi:hypothetical protein
MPYLPGALVVRSVTRILVLPVAFALGCSLPTADDAHLVSSLRFSPGGFDSFKANTQLMYTLAAPSTVSLSITRADTTGAERLVKTLARDMQETGGVHAHMWLGDTDGGIFAPAGEYTGVLSIGNHCYATTVVIFHF